MIRMEIDSSPEPNSSSPIIRIVQVSHVASVEGWPLPDCSTEISFSFELWHLDYEIAKREPRSATADTNEDTSSLETSTSFPLQLENREFNLEDSSLYIPPYQMRMIQNINTLISELGLEKQELVQALSAESSQSSMLKELNKELSRKLEVQTQRLELLTAQSMANEIIPLRQTESRTIDDNNSAYADEGDEVVERVLGWIMKLFPGGPSRRRTNKLL